VTDAQYAVRLRSVCLARTAAPVDVAALEGDARRWLRYRRMVRSRISGTLAQAFPRLAAILGAEHFSALEARFLESGALASPSLRDVPAEFVAWLRSARSTDVDAVPLPALELAELESAERAMAMAPDDPEIPLGPLAMDRPAALTRAHRLLAFEHAVHRVAPPAVLLAPPALTWLCVYRDRETLVTRTLELSAVTHALLEALGREEEPLVDCVNAAAARTGVAVDAAFVRALGGLLGDLSERGILRGART